MLMKADIRVILPEIADYEVRRELLRANKIKGEKLLYFGRRCDKKDNLRQEIKQLMVI